jgi:predicted dehydrogenase
MKSRRKKLTCGVIGIGWWGTQMLNHIIASKDFKILTVYDPSREAAKQAARKSGCAIAGSADELIKDQDIECVFIFSPNDSHLQYTVAAARAGKHIFLEKPISNTVTEAEDIVRVCRDMKVILAVGHNVRHYAIFQRAKEIIDEGSIGVVIYIEGNRSRPIGSCIDEQSWRFYENSCNGGPLIQMAIHLIDVVRFVSGWEVGMFKTLSAKRFLRTENDESYSVSAKSASGMLLHFFTSYVSPESFYLNFHGKDGILFVDPFNGLYLQKKDSTIKKRMRYKKNQPEIDEIFGFYKSVSKHQPYLDPSPEEAVDNVRVIEQILSSIKQS